MTQIDNSAVAGNGAGVLPRKASAGVALHFSSLPNAHGIGDIADSAKAFIDQLRSMHIRVWQFLPTGPTAYGDSPYQPLSAFAGNENLIGLDPLIRDGLLQSDEVASLNDLPLDTVDYGHLIPQKQSLLDAAAERFLVQASDQQRQDYAAFLQEHDAAWLADYAVYRILKTQHAERPWPEWSREFVKREPEAMERIYREQSQAIEQIKVQQFFFDHQWQALRQYANANDVRLFGDMPIYIALDSADAWSHPEMLLIDDLGKPSHVAGVPPDYFSDDGQLWGNPLYDWAHHAADGYGWWVDRMAHAAQLNDLVRVDHFRGFESYWSVPFGQETAREGRWEPGPGDALFVAMQTALGSLPIVAEDLGVITDEVDALRERHHIPGMVVLQFDVSDPEFDPAAIPEHCVCYSGTHDNDTTVGWFLGTDEDTRTDDEIADTRRRALAVTGCTAENIHWGMVKLAFESPANLAVAPMQDFLGLGSDARLNIPGTTMDNWRWRLLDSQMSKEFLESVSGLIISTGRI